MLLDPRYLQADLLDELSKLNVTELPAVVAEHMGNILKSVSRTECYVTGNVDQDGVSLTHNLIIQTMTLCNIDITLCNMVICVVFSERLLIHKNCENVFANCTHTVPHTINCPVNIYVYHLPTTV